MKPTIPVKKLLLFFSLWFSMSSVQAQKVDSVAVLIIGGGASGTAAALQAARMGVPTLVLEETTWLGGMLTSAGVSAIDGNKTLPSGIWGEFRDALHAHYGGPAAVATGWVSSTLFEPSVGNQIFQKKVAETPHLEVRFQTQWKSIQKAGTHWKVTAQSGKKKHTIISQIVIDATELGDVSVAVGAAFEEGMDDRAFTGESFAPEKGNDVLQDLTYVMILKEHAPGVNKTIPKPAGYDPKEFIGCCGIADPASYDKPVTDCAHMMRYGKLPNGKYMINWPHMGNDFYLNLLHHTPKEREVLLKEAKLHTLRFLYYLQTELGFSNFSLADDEFPTADKLPMIPYHRESRRVHGESLFTLNHVLHPFNQPEALYRTGVAVGDYTIDHHRAKHPGGPQIDFVKIRVPSYNVPVGSLIPKGISNFIVAEKSISVSNIVNGATRLQPVVLGIGQAAGVLAALSVQEGKTPSEVAVRSVQQKLLDAGAYLMPYLDIPLGDPNFASIHKVGATGAIRGVGVPYNWSNQTWFYPDQLVSEYELISNVRSLYPEWTHFWGASGKPLRLEVFIQFSKKMGMDTDLNQLPGTPNLNTLLNRRMVAVLVDQIWQTFEKVPINLQGLPMH
jgi:hypothetical protein